MSNEIGVPGSRENGVATAERESAAAAVSAGVQLVIDGVLTPEEQAAQEKAAAAVAAAEARFGALDPQVNEGACAKFLVDGGNSRFSGENAVKIRGLDFDLRNDREAVTLVHAAASVATGTLPEGADLGTVDGLKALVASGKKELENAQAARASIKAAYDAAPKEFKTSPLGSAVIALEEHEKEVEKILSYRQDALESLEKTIAALPELRIVAENDWNEVSYELRIPVVQDFGSFKYSRMTGEQLAGIVLDAVKKALCA